MTGSSASPAKGTFQKEELLEWTWAMPSPFSAVDTGPERQSRLPKVTEQGLEVCPPGNLPEVMSSQGTVKVVWGGTLGSSPRLGGQARE